MTFPEDKMGKTHATLRPLTNLFMIVIWGFLSLLLFILCKPYPVVMTIAGCILGIVGGTLQNFSFREAGPAILQAKSMIEIRSQLRLTISGKRYIYFLWSGFVLLFVLALYSSKPPFIPLLHGYFMLMFVREFVTFWPLLKLHRMHSVTTGNIQN